MELEPGEQVFFHGHPSWRSMLGHYIKGFVAAVLGGAVVGFLTAIASGRVQDGWVVAVVLAVFIVVLGRGLLKQVRVTYTITNRRLTIDVGVLARRVRETRLSRVQNVNARQSLIERLLDVGTVDFDTAGGADYDFLFSGVASPQRIVRTVHRALWER